MEHSWREREKRKKNENFINIWLFIQIFLLKAASVKISTLLMPCRYVNMLNNWLNSEILCFEYCFHLQEGWKSPIKIRQFLLNLDLIMETHPSSFREHSQLETSSVFIWYSLEDTELCLIGWLLNMAGEEEATGASVLSGW